MNLTVGKNIPSNSLVEWKCTSVCLTYRQIFGNKFQLFNHISAQFSSNSQLLTGSSIWRKCSHKPTAFFLYSKNVGSLTTLLYYGVQRDARSE